MGGNRKNIERLISQRFAVIVIAILLGASAAGWILTEIIPRDYSHRREIYIERWGGTLVGVIDTLRLDDPFHSIWYSSVLALFFIVLFLCIVTRWRGFIRRAFVLEAPVTKPGVKGSGLGFEVRYGMPVPREEGARDILDEFESRYGRRSRIEGENIDRVHCFVTSLLRQRGFRVAGRRVEDGFLLAACRGRWRFLGNLIFHAGLLVITAGGIIGGIGGTSELLYGRIGDELRLQGTPYSLGLLDFRIEITSRGEIMDYISTLAVLDGKRDTLRTADIEVNKPLRVAGYNIYQSEYFVDVDEFRWAGLRVRRKGEMATESLRLEPGIDASIAGTGLVVRPLRFLPDFRTGSDGPFSASPMMNNPALEIELKNESTVERGWLFIRYPEFDHRFTFPCELRLVSVEPVFYSGLQVSRNPGSAALFCGFGLATIGVLMLYLSHFRLLNGFVGPESIVIAGVRDRWKFSFKAELESLAADIERGMPGLTGKGQSK